MTPHPRDAPDLLPRREPTACRATGRALRAESDDHTARAVEESQVGKNRLVMHGRFSLGCYVVSARLPATH